MKNIRSLSMTLSALLLCAGLSMAQPIVPDGTPIRVRLESSLSPETSQLGDTVEFSVTEDVRAGASVVVAKGARAMGSIVELQRRGHMGKAGKLNFSIERVEAVDGSWHHLRYTPQPSVNQGGAKAGIIGPPVFAQFFRGAGICYLPKPRAAEWPRGRNFDVFIDERADLNTAGQAETPKR